MLADCNLMTIALAVQPQLLYRYEDQSKTGLLSTEITSNQESLVS